MIFRGKLQRNTPVWRHWRGESRASGTLAGVVFKYVMGDNYVTDDLDGDQVARLRTHPDVQLEMFGGYVPLAEPVIPPPPQVVASAAPNRNARGGRR